MRIPRIYSSSALTAHAECTLDSNASQHLCRVLRLDVGAQLRLFDGSGHDYPAQLLTTSAKACQVQLGEACANHSESPIHTTLWQAISKGDKMDFTIQKAVELGVNRIVPVFSQRSVIKLNGDRLQRKLEHWQSVAISACEQSGRAYIPEVAQAHSFKQVLAAKPQGLKLTLAPHATHSLAALPKPTQAVHLLIGPEGGLSETELDLATSVGWQRCRLGPRVLRTETAALATLACMQALWGDFC